MKPLFALLLTAGLGAAPAMAQMPATPPAPTALPQAAAPQSAVQTLHPLTLQLNWVPQAQFGGYFMALERGFYAEEGIDLTILAGGGPILPLEELAAGRADLVVEGLAPALVARENGLAVVNIAQFSQATPQVLYCRQDSAVLDASQDLNGRVIGTWFGGHEYPLMAWLNATGQSAAALVRLGSAPEALAQKQSDCVSVPPYLDDQALAAAGLGPDMVRKLDLHGDALLGEGLYMLEPALNHRGTQDLLAGFLRATAKGWREAEAHPDQVGAALQKHAPDFDIDLPAAARMAEKIAAYVQGTNGRMPEDGFQRSVAALQAGGENALLRRAPNGGYSHLIHDKAFPPTAAALPENPAQAPGQAISSAP